MEMKQKEIKNHDEGVCRSMILTNELGGISNTPLNDKNKDKQILIDWLSYTFSDIEYDEAFNTYTQSLDVRIRNNKTNTYILQSILKLIDIDNDWKTMKQTNWALNGYRFSWEIGEYIKINFAGPKMLDGNYSTQLLFSGSACREFESYYNGSFIDLFNFLFSEHKELGHLGDENGEIFSARYLNGSVKRIDIAIDDFTGKEQNIYDLKEYADKHWWIGSYKTVSFHDSSMRNGFVQSKGFSISFGSAGSNQLVIYDKLLERKYHNIDCDDKKVWYRYEMRFAQDKADQVARNYRTYNKLGKLSNYVLGLLNGCIEFKDIRDKYKVDFSRQYLRTQPTLESWKRFIEYTEKIKFEKTINQVRTIDKKLKWIDSSLTTTFAEIYLINRNDLEKFYNQILKFVNKGMFNLTKKHLTAINKYLIANDKKIITDDEYLKIKSYGLIKRGEDNNAA